MWVALAGRPGAGFGDTLGRRSRRSDAGNSRPRSRHCCQAPPRSRKKLNPFLDFAQSLPHFANLIPVAVFIGVGPKAGAIVTMIFALPPMVRMTLLGVKKVSPEILRSGKTCGSSSWQQLRRLRVPTAKPKFSWALIS